MSLDATQNVDLDLDSRLPENPDDNNIADPVDQPSSEEPSNFELDPVVKKSQQLLDEKKKEQQRRRKAEDELALARQQLKDHEESKLKEKQEYKALYESQKKEFAEFRQEVASKDSLLVKREKKLAVMKELGRLRKDSYSEFIDFDSVIIEDEGEINHDSVKLVANKFRQDYPELIERNPGNVLDNSAPSTNTTIQTKKKGLRDLTKADKAAIRREAAKNTAS